MKTQNSFWNCFLILQPDLLVAYENGDAELILYLIDQLNDHPTLKDLSLELSIFFPAENHHKVKLQFRTYGIMKKKKAATQLIQEAPVLDTWVYKAGIEPYPYKKEPLASFFSEIGEIVSTNQVYVSLLKFYKTSKKTHLLVFIKLDRTGVPKNEIKPFVCNLMIHYLGEDLYYKKISRIKIIRRKPKNIHFFPLRDLKNRFDFIVAN